MIGLTIDGKKVEVEAGGTILDAARKIGIDMPTMCYLDGHTAETSCMVCVVRVKGRSRLVPACATKAEDGMVVENATEEVTAARRTALELLLGDHVGDCVGLCQSACPAHMDIPTMIRQVAEGRYREAIATVKQHIALPAVLGRICPEVCEKGCRRAAYDAPVSICLIKRFVADLDLASDRPYLPECKLPSGRRAAIIGAGPAGLASAYYLAREGHSCVIFDERPLPGGMLRYGVPVERLPHDVLDAEIALIAELGVDFRQNARIADANALDDLCAEFDAVLLATGKSASTLGLETDGDALRVDRATMMTNRPGVFAAGSAIHPSHLAVRAVADGRSAAAAIAQYFDGKPIVISHRPYSVHIGRLLEGEVSEFMSGVSASGRVTPSGSGLNEAEAARESARCLHCECGKLQGCKLRNHGIAYQANPSAFKGDRQRVTRQLDHPSVIYESGKCISCGLCVRMTADAGEQFGLTLIGRGFDVRPGVPFDEPFAIALCKVAQECAEACPTGALVMKGDGDKSHTETD